jgi:hypothetical protein
MSSGSAAAASGVVFEFVEIGDLVRRTITAFVDCACARKPGAASDAGMLC